MSWAHGRHGVRWVNHGRRHTYLPRHARRVHRHGHDDYHHNGLYFSLLYGVYVQVNFDDDCLDCDHDVHNVHYVDHDTHYAGDDVEVWY